MIKKTVLILTLASIAATAQAGKSSVDNSVLENEQDTWEFELGVGAASYKSLYKGVGTQSGALPVFSARYNDFYLEGTELGYQFYETEDSSTYIAIGSGDLFDGERSKSSQTAIKVLGDVDEGINLTLGGETFTPIGVISASISGDVSGEHGGTQASLGWSLPMEYEKLMLMPNVDISWASADVVNHYYGVSSSQAAKSGFAKYNAGSATIITVGINAEYQLSDQWSALGGVSYSQFSSAVTDSSLIDKDDSSNAFVGVSYRW